MTIKDNAVLVIDTGNYFLAPEGTVAPANLLAPGTPWTNVGHTSLEDILSLSSEGGEATVIGTLQSKSLRTSYSARTETLTFTLNQFDEDSLKLYFGRNMTYTSDARFMGVPENPQPTVCAFLVVFVDGDEHFAFYAPKVEVIRGDDLSLGDTSSVSGLPLNVSPKKLGDNTWTWAVTPIGTNPMATGATQGAPGTYSPAGATAPYNQAGLTSVTASPTTKWTTGNYIKIGDNTEWYWNGTAWTAGRST